MITGIVFVGTCVYLSLLVSFVHTLNERGYARGIMFHTARRWGKFLLLLVVLGAIVQILTIL
jgi:hypothetical protein